MKKLINLAIGLSAISLFLASCSFSGSKPCFELNCETLKTADYVLAGEDVYISNCTDDGLAFSWDFGDGNTSTLDSPHHVWETPGEYTITLEVENEKSTKSKSMVITVNPSLYGSWSGTFTNGEEPVPISFELVQTGNKVKGSFDYAGSYFATGVLSSNSVIEGDSVKLICALIYTFGDQSFSSMFQFEGTVNETLTEMSGPFAIINTRKYGPWTVTKQ